MNPLPQAANDGDVSLVEKFISQSTTMQTDMDLALGRACCSGHSNVAEVLLQHGADPNGQYETEPGKFEYGPIILASCEFLNADGIKWLLVHGANPNGNPTGSSHVQVCTPLEMVRDSYIEDETARRRCHDLLVNSIAKET